jgi:hypothetical protein
MNVIEQAAYRQQEEKRNAGRYTLAEAAALIATEGNEWEEQIVGKLVGAAKRKELLVYEPGKNSPLEYGAGAGMLRVVRTFYEECFWDELNTWLETFAPRVTFRFPKPTPDLSPGTLSARGINKDQVMKAFGELVKGIDFKKALGNGKGLFGDCGARTQKGTPGGRHKALWNPVILAVGLKEKCYVTKPHLKMAFNDHSFLSDWADEWADALELLGE